MTFLKELREAARLCSNIDYAALLRQAADSLEFSINTLQREPTVDRMTELNCAWAHAHAALKNLPPEGEPSPVSGSPEPAILAAPARMAA